METPEHLRLHPPLVLDETEYAVIEVVPGAMNLTVHDVSAMVHFSFQQGDAYNQYRKEVRRHPNVIALFYVIQPFQPVRHAVIVREQHLNTVEYYDYSLNVDGHFGDIYIATSCDVNEQYQRLTKLRLLLDGTT